MTKGEWRDIGSLAGIILFAVGIVFAVVMAIRSHGASNVQSKIAASK